MVQAIFHDAGIQPHKDEESESSEDDGDAGQPVPTDRAVYSTGQGLISFCVKLAIIPGPGTVLRVELALAMVLRSTVPMSLQVGLPGNGTSFSSRRLSSTRLVVQFRRRRFRP